MNGATPTKLAHHAHPSNDYKSIWRFWTITLATKVTAKKVILNSSSFWRKTLPRPIAKPKNSTKIHRRPAAITAPQRKRWAHLPPPTTHFQLKLKITYQFEYISGSKGVAKRKTTSMMNENWSIKSTSKIVSGKHIFVNVPPTHGRTTLR